jgi:hypothetical protein
MFHRLHPLSLPKQYYHLGTEGSNVCACIQTTMPYIALTQTWISTLSQQCCFMTSQLSRPHIIESTLFTLLPRMQSIFYLSNVQSLSTVLQCYIVFYDSTFFFYSSPLYYILTTVSSPTHPPQPPLLARSTPPPSHFRKG